MSVKDIILKIIMPREKLSQRFISASIWSGFSKVGMKLLFLVRTVILARLLAPADFGLFGIALIVISFLNTFTQSGIGEALVQKKGDTIDDYLDSAWTIKVIRGFVLASALFLCAPYIADFFNEPQATDLFYVIAMALVFGGLGNSGIIYFRKNLEFHKDFVYEFSAVVVDLIVSIVLAFVLRDAFALAYGYLAGMAMRCVMSFVLHDFRPRFHIRVAHTKELINFGKWIWGNYILAFFLMQGAATFIGKIFPVAFLGIFQIAQRLTNTLTSEVAGILGMVTYPLYSKLQDDYYRLQSAYIKIFKIILFMLMPATFFVWGFAEDLVLVILGQKWILAIPITRILVVSGLCMAISGSISNLLTALGRPDISTKINITKILLLAVIIYPLSMKWSLEGTSLAVLIMNASPLPIFLFLLNKKIHVKFADILSIIGIPLINACITLILVKYVVQFNVFDMNVLNLSMNFILGAFFYLALSFLADRLFNYGLSRALNKDFIMNALGLDCKEA